MISSFYFNSGKWGKVFPSGSFKTGETPRWKRALLHAWRLDWKEMVDYPKLQKP